LVGGVIVSYIAERHDFEVKEELEEEMIEEK